MTMTDALARAIDVAVATVRRNLAGFGTTYPDDCTVDGRYHPRAAEGEFAEGANRGWTTSFVPGLQWLAFEITGGPDLRAAAQAHAEDFADRVRARRDVAHHDLGFLATLAAVAPWRILGDEAARDTALEAADLLLARLCEPAGIIQAWGDPTDPDQRGRAIIDSLMNMPLLAFAGEQTGDPRFGEAVRRHTAQLARHIVRADDTTFHTFTWDAVTGEPRGGSTAQGAADDSCWARGQAWGVYGFALGFQLTGNADLLDAAQRCADYLLAHLPADLVPYWDLVYTDGDGEPRDASAAAIAACGLHELSRLGSDDARAAGYHAAGERLLRALVTGYTPQAVGVDSDALNLHSVYDRRTGSGVDEGCLWGDYFYLEALVRYTRPFWRRYW